MPETTVRNPRRRARLPFVAALAGLVVIALGLFVLSSLGTWLEIDEPLQHAKAIVVLGGGVPFRAMEAASLYKEGWAGEVWLMQASLNESEKTMAQLGIAQIRDHEYSRSVLEKLGVPAKAIRVVPEPVDNTLAEVRAVLRYEQTAGGHAPLILVSSKYHTRRVRVIWNAVTKGRETAVVRYATLETFEARKWWRTTTDALATFREAFGILNAWAGFPISPRER